jgi:hypothetical protein
MPNITTKEDGYSMSKMSILLEFWEFLRARKKWILALITFFLLLLGILIVFTEGSALAPFIYTLF